MASSKGGDMKGFYRQKKGSISKKSTDINSLFAPPNPKTPLLNSSSSTGEYDVKEEEVVALRDFDMNMKYGPCLGMSRLARWERASKLGLNPPPDIERLLKLTNARSTCLWEGRV